ncbi:MAG TPA: YceI family protein [Streptosporangiaceae bacterium]|jgi:polyisoprenoid-binding protein YceI|nr:YceI family protein [Streptosporangiaceae bacterium]
MAIATGRHHLGTENGRLILRTSRDGMAATAGHDLTIEATRWSGELTVDDDKNPSALEATIDMGALSVVKGEGGIKPLSDRDRREVATTARRLLATDRNPEAHFAATRFEPSGDGGTIEGDLTIRGVTHPIRLQVTQPEPGKYRASGTVKQTDYGIRPYTAFLGALKVRDAVELEATVEVPEPGDTGE